MTTDLNSKRKRILVVTFVFQILTTIVSQVVGELVKSDRLQIPMAVFVFLQLIVLFGVHFFAFITIRSYFKKKIYVVLYGINIFLAFILNTIAGIPSIPAEIAPTINAFSILLGLISMVIWCAVIVKDIFLEVHDLTYRILGAANIYSLLIVIFAYGYIGFEFWFPGSIALPPQTGPELINSCFKLSLHTMVSIDHRFQLSLALENLTLVQATISHLFMVFLVGRLLTK